MKLKTASRHRTSWADSGVLSQLALIAVCIPLMTGCRDQEERVNADSRGRDSSPAADSSQAEQGACLTSPNEMSASGRNEHEAGLQAFLVYELQDSMSVIFRTTLGHVLARIVGQEFSPKGVHAFSPRLGQCFSPELGHRFAHKSLYNNK